MAERYIPAQELADHRGVHAWGCTHCGCLIWDRARHDREYALDLRDTAEKALADAVKANPGAAGILDDMFGAATTGEEPA